MTLAYALMLAAHSHLTLAQSGADSLLTARLAWGSDPEKRCPDLRNASAEEGTVAVVQFMVGPTGVPSRASVRESSGSEGFDAAAVSCVQKLHFQAATRLGDGVPVESWQQLALKSAAPATAPQAVRCDPAGTGPGSGARNSMAVAGAADSNDGARAPPGPETARAGVCVCVDESGKITQTPVLTNSSGIASFDKAALELSAAARYRPPVAASGRPAPGCFRFKVGLDMK